MVPSSPQFYSFLNQILGEGDVPVSYCELYLTYAQWQKWALRWDSQEIFLRKLWEKLNFSIQMWLYLARGINILFCFWYLLISSRLTNYKVLHTFVYICFFVFKSTHLQPFPSFLSHCCCNYYNHGTHSWLRCSWGVAFSCCSVCIFDYIIWVTCFVVE